MATMHRTKSSTSKLKLITVKKCALITILLCCGFLAGVVLGCFVGLRHSETQSGPRQKNIKTNCLNCNYDYDDSSEEIFYKINEMFALSKEEDVPVYLRDFSTLPEYSKSHFVKKFNLTSWEHFVTVHNYHIETPQFDPARNSFVEFYVQNEEASKVVTERFSGPCISYFSGGNVEQAGVVLIRDDYDFKDLDVSFVERALVLTSFDSSYIKKAQVLKMMGARGILFYEKSKLKNCSQKSSVYDKPSWFYGDPLTPGYPATEGTYNLPLKKLNIPKLPMEVISCDTLSTILPYLKKKPTGESEGLLAHLQTVVKLHHKVVSNLMVSFRGDKEPDLSIVLGACRQNVNGTKRLLRFINTVSLAIHDNRFLWTPRHTIRFVSWGEKNVGMIEFIETYKSTWKDKLIAYVDLDYYHVDGNSYFETSSSLENLLEKVMEQSMQPKNNSTILINTMNNRIETNPVTGGELFEQEMGVPYVKSYSGNKGGDDENDIFRILGMFMISVADAGMLGISLEETLNDVLKVINHLIDAFPSVKIKIPILNELPRQLGVAIRIFENFLEGSLAFQLEKSFNILILKVENKLRSLKHSLECLIPEPTLKLLESVEMSMNDLNKSQKFFYSICKSKSFSYMEPWHHNDNFEDIVLHETSLIASEIQDVIKILSSHD